MYDFKDEHIICGYCSCDIIGLYYFNKDYGIICLNCQKKLENKSSLKEKLTNSNPDEISFNYDSLSLGFSTVNSKQSLISPSFKSSDPINNEEVDIKEQIIEVLEEEYNESNNQL